MSKLRIWLIQDTGVHGKGNERKAYEDIENHLMCVSKLCKHLNRRKPLQAKLLKRLGHS